MQPRHSLLLTLRSPCLLEGHCMTDPGTMQAGGAAEVGEPPTPRESPRPQPRWGSAGGLGNETTPGRQSCGLLLQKADYFNIICFFPPIIISTLFSLDLVKLWRFFFVCLLFVSFKCQPVPRGHKKEGVFPGACAGERVRLGIIRGKEPPGGDPPRNPSESPPLHPALRRRPRDRVRAAVSLQLRHPDSCLTHASGSCRLLWLPPCAHGMFRSPPSFKKPTYYCPPWVTKPLEGTSVLASSLACFSPDPSTHPLTWPWTCVTTSSCPRVPLAGASWH